jgi:hypothetical protein
MLRTPKPQSELYGLAFIGLQRAPVKVRPSSNASARPVKDSGFSPSGISLGLDVAKTLQGYTRPISAMDAQPSPVTMK